MADDGIGDEAVTRERLGMQLVEALAAQLRGHMEVDRGPTDTVQRLIFPVAAPGDAE